MHASSHSSLIVEHGPTRAPLVRDQIPLQVDFLSALAFKLTLRKAKCESFAHGLPCGAATFAPASIFDRRRNAFNGIFFEKQK
jgi:hypothetical protein